MRIASARPGASRSITARLAALGRVMHGLARARCLAELGHDERGDRSAAGLDDVVVVHRVEHDLQHEEHRDGLAERTAQAWPLKVRSSLPVLASQTLAVRSSDAVSTHRPSRENAAELIRFV